MERGISVLEEGSFLKGKISFFCIFPYFYKIRWWTISKVSVYLKGLIFFSGPVRAVVVSAEDGAEPRGPQKY
jgi:hypothetical protein